MMKTLIIAFGIALTVSIAATPARSGPAVCGVDEKYELGTFRENNKKVTKSICTKMLCKGSTDKKVCDRLEALIRAVEQPRRHRHHETIKRFYLNETVQI